MKPTLLLFDTRNSDCLTDWYLLGQCVYIGNLVRSMSYIEGSSVIPNLCSKTTVAVAHDRPETDSSDVRAVTPVAVELPLSLIRFDSSGIIESLPRVSRTDVVSDCG